MVFGHTQRMLFRQLFPITDEVEIADYVRGFHLAGAALPDRPYTVANFVSSADGRASVEGRSRGLADDGDKALFGALRAVADAVLVGTGTLEAERYGRLIKSADVRERRRAEGLAGEPLACMLTRSGRLPLDIPLFAEPEARVVVFSGAAVQIGSAAAQVDVVRLAPDELDFAHALKHLRTEHHVRAVLCEGGPTVLNALLREQVLNELFLTLAPKLVGGGAEIPITVGAALTKPADVVLAGVLERDGTLFLRYQRANQV
jgi:riboflavin biosynthesis pyrimidine reductase